MDERVVLAKRAANIKTSVNELASAYEALKANLNENETYTQVKCYFFTHSIILVTSRNSYTLYDTYDNLSYQNGKWRRALQ